MKWYVVVALGFCAANFVASLALLGLSSYHLYDSDGFIPIKESEEWFSMVIGLIPYCIFVVIVSLFSCWGVIQKNRKWAACVVALNALCISGAIFFVVIFTQQANADPISDEILLEHTKKSIEKHDLKDEETAWIPPWLDHIQSKSSTCCGISTYKDWEELWSSHNRESLIPESCCITPSNDTSVCPRDLARIPYPGTPAKFIKVEHGCSEDINMQIKRHIMETYKFVWILTAMLIAGEIAYSLLYFFRYQFKGGATDVDISTKKVNDNDIVSAGDSELAVDDSKPGSTKMTVEQFCSKMDAVASEIRINPDTGNPILAFNVINYSNTNSNNFLASQSGSGSLAAASASASGTKVQPLLPAPGNTVLANDAVLGNMTASPIDTFTYTKKNKTIEAGNESTNVLQPPRAVYLVQDTSDYIGNTMDAKIASGGASATSLDDFGDLPSAEAKVNTRKGQTKQNADKKRHY